MQVLIVESYGGRDEPVDTLTNNFVGVGVEPVLEPVRVKEVPNEATYQVRALQLLSCCCLYRVIRGLSDLTLLVAQVQLPWHAGLQLTCEGQTWDEILSLWSMVLCCGMQRCTSVYMSLWSHIMLFFQVCHHSSPSELTCSVKLAEGLCHTCVPQLCAAQPRHQVCLPLLMRLARTCFVVYQAMTCCSSR